MAKSLYEKIKIILESRGNPDVSFITDIVLIDNSDGNPPFINKWNEEKLGPKPTEEELNNIQ